eukprot:CAMPEP_0179086814 /NCGR_PEP_ID=MMETSP0796-20121207/39408_1 /TAXON_ID=73915 /ORGANISM="Pyrodinium bahamense, Strain pbaha01" /LENGTH=583 /DNA_ID=CAMNT_0020784305 /DNA_START=74 /DNA_END=1826 /DNA_ORIENTATION=-
MAPEEGCTEESLTTGEKPRVYGSIGSLEKEKQTLGAVADPAVGVGIPVVCWFILVVELCERLSFYTFTGSQAFFLEHLGFSLASAGGLNATMWTFCTVLAVVASWAADVALGRYATILAAGGVYFAGTGVASIAAWPGVNSAALYLMGVMVLLPLGTAGIKANISNFGADQYDTSDPASARAQERFFSIFYLSINVGAGVSFGFFTTFASNGGLGVPKSHGYFAAYALMTLCMGLAVCIFRAGRSSYKVHPLQDSSALASVARSLLLASRAAAGGPRSCTAVAWLLLATVALSTLQACAPHLGNSMMAAAFCSAGLGTLAIVLPCLRPSWLGAWREEGPEPWELEVQGFLRVLPVLFTGNLAFGALYNCMQFWYQLQACQMDVRIGAGGFQLSGSFFNIADCLAIVIFTPVLVDWLNPIIEQAMGLQLRHGLKFAFGMLVAIVSVIVAARLEQMRRGAAVLPAVSNCAPAGISMSDVRASWMMVPFFLMGIGEIYCQPTLLHFAYSKSPATMRTLATATSFFISGISSAIFAVVVAALSPIIPNDLSTGHLEYGYFVNISMAVVFYLFFVLVLSFAPGDAAQS